MSRQHKGNYLPDKSDKLSSMQATRADIQRQYSNVSRRESRRVQKMNAMIVGSGASTAQDRGSNQQIAWTSLNPFFDPNPLSRWMRFARWYYTDPFAKKVVDIPIDDAFRKPFIIKGLTDADNKALMKAYKQLDGDRQFKRVMKQERLFGGSLIYMPIADSTFKGERSIENPINFESLKAGLNPLGMGAQEVPLNIKALNVIDIMRIWQANYTVDYFSPDYDKPSTFTIQQMPVHIDRLITFDGDALFNRNVINIYMPWRANPSGFGESILTPLHDLLVRVTGTQEGAYHLVNLASCLLMKCKDLKGLGATKGGANVVAALQDIVATISMYRAALLEADDAEITQHSATFGSVPELVMTFLVILSAACDIPATRFLGQAPGGLNATGESDLENYYDHVDSIQKNRITPRLMKLFKIIGSCLWGADGWAAREEKIEIEHPPLWNMDEKEQAESNEIVSRYMLSLYDSGIINDEQLFDELKANNIFRTDMKFDTQLADLRKKLLESESEDAFGDGGGNKGEDDKDPNKKKTAKDK